MLNKEIGLIKSDIFQLRQIFLGNCTNQVVFYSRFSMFRFEVFACFIKDVTFLHLSVKSQISGTAENSFN